MIAHIHFFRCRILDFTVIATAAVLLVSIHLEVARPYPINFACEAFTLIGTDKVSTCRTQRILVLRDDVKGIPVARPYAKIILPELVEGRLEILIIQIKISLNAI